MLTPVTRPSATQGIHNAHTLVPMGGSMTAAPRHLASNASAPPPSISAAAEAAAREAAEAAEAAAKTRAKQAGTLGLPMAPAAAARDAEEDWEDRQRGVEVDERDDSDREVSHAVAKPPPKPTTVASLIAGWHPGVKGARQRGAPNQAAAVAAATAAEASPDPQEAQHTKHRRPNKKSPPSAAAAAPGEAPRALIEQQQQQPAAARGAQQEESGEEEAEGDKRVRRSGRLRKLRLDDLRRLPVPIG